MLCILKLGNYLGYRLVSVPMVTILTSSIFFIRSCRDGSFPSSMRIRLSLSGLCASCSSSAARSLHWESCLAKVITTHSNTVQFYLTSIYYQEMQKIVFSHLRALPSPNRPSSVCLLSKMEMFHMWKLYWSLIMAHYQLWPYWATLSSLQLEAS